MQADGTLQWTKFIGGSANDGISAMTTGLDGSIYVAGYTTSSFNQQTHNGGTYDYDGFLAKYNTNGEMVWTKFIGGSANDIIRAMTTGLDGSIYVAGYTTSSFNQQTHNGGTDDGFLAKYNTNGEIVWTKFIGGSGNDVISAMTTGLDGSIYVAGYTASSFNQQTHNGGTDDGFLAKYNTNGEIVWTKFIGGSANDIISAMTTGLDGSIYVAGYTASSFNQQTHNGGTDDGFLAKYSEQPISQFSFRYPGVMNFSTKKSSSFKPREYNKTQQDQIYYHATKKMPDGIVFNPRSGKIAGQPTSQFSDITMSIWVNNFRKKITLTCSE